MIIVNGREYPLPVRPTAVLCLDGCDPAYVDDALASANVPTLSRWAREGTFALGDAAIPSFTNPNNVSIVTGVSPGVHGISGNHFYDPSAGSAVPMNRREHIRCQTIVEALADAGVRVLCVTAKDKLRRLLSPGTTDGALSVERADSALCELLGERPPGIYSGKASLAVLDVGVAALASGRFDLVYLSTTDYVQHKHAPGSPAARRFMEAIDARLAKLDALGADVALTADHGMNDKTRPDGSPNVVYLEPRVSQLAGDAGQVVLPITDPHVVHHGSLGSAACVYAPRHVLSSLSARLLETQGIEVVYGRDEAASRLELPPDRIGDLFVLADRSTVLGSSPGAHDLSGVRRGLRSHGGLHEAKVPLIFNRRFAVPAGVRNSDVFAMVLG